MQFIKFGITWLENEVGLHTVYGFWEGGYDLISSLFSDFDYIKILKNYNHSFVLKCLYFRGNAVVYHFLYTVNDSVL